jgi:hypothetical protein
MDRARDSTIHNRSEEKKSLVECARRQDEHSFT